MPRTPVSRRAFLSAGAFTGVAPAFAAAQNASPGANRPRLWIDPRLAALPSLPWRKIHLDFHNSHHIPKIGERFRADEFGDRLLAAHVNAIVVFAKDMHGYFYYPSRYGPVHPGLDFDLLGAQVEACRKRGIAVYAYYCTCWDNYLAARHPEWLQIRRDGSSYLPKPDETPGWTGLCLAHPDFVDLMARHTEEFVSRYPIDGAWFDMPVARDNACFCPACLKALQEAGLDPESERVQRLRSHQLHVAFLRRMHEVVKKTRPGCQVDFNQQGRFGLPERLPYLDNVDIEALPTASWGYFYFPTIVRYVRTHGVPTYGMTGRFKASWADFGGLKQPAQLITEVAGIVAQGARCDIGDQMPPDGKLDEAVYHVIGKAYAHVEKLEDYLMGAVPVTEAALLVSGFPTEQPSREAVYGLVKLLTELRVQFDLLEPEQPWERYPLVVLAEDKPVADATITRLTAYLEQGGAVIAVQNGALREGTNTSWCERYGIAYAGASEYRPAYLIPRVPFTGDIPTYEYALYQGATRWRVQPPAEMLAELGVPLFQRSPQHFTSHAQTPFHRATGEAVIARSARLGVIGMPLGTSYFREGYWVYRQALGALLERVYPSRLLHSNAPLSTELTVTHQAAQASPRRPERWLVHIVNYSPVRGAPPHPVFHDDPIPLTDVRVTLRLPLRPRAARACVSGALLALETTASTVSFTVPRIPIHELVCLEMDA